jgi:predicted nuclease of predicted toxin-antitoxin system
MKILLDHDLPKRLRPLFRGHLALMARQMAWDALSNGRLLAAAEAQQFDVLVTADKKMFEQQQHLDRKIGLVVLSTSLMIYLEPGFPLVLAAVQRAGRGSFEAVEIPEHAAVQNRIEGV